MKPFYLWALFMLFTIESISQSTRFNRKDDSLITNAVYILFNLDSNGTAPLTTKLPFNKIIFFDERYDTTYIAINWQANAHVGLGEYIQNRKFNLTNGLASGLTDYFNYYFANNFSGDAEMVCFIKKFSVGLKDSLIEDQKPDESINRVKFGVECFYKYHDLLYPAIKIDTSFTYAIAKIKRTASDLTKDMFNSLLQKLVVIDTVKILKRNSYTFEKVESIYQSRFNLPILTATQYKRGVYKNFKEFIHNEPSITKFTIKKEGVKLLLYDEHGEIITKVFGFCDGDDCWRFGGAFCSKLIPVANSFEYFFTIYIVGDFITTTKKLLLSLDMETGGVN